MSKRTARHRQSVKNMTLIRYWFQHMHRTIQNWLYKNGWN